MRNLTGHFCLFSIILLLLLSACRFETLPKGIQDDIVRKIASGQYEEALKDLEKMERFAPVVNMAWVYGERGYIYLEQGKYQEAIDVTTKAIELDPSNASWYNNRGLAYEKMRKFEQAETDFTTAISLEPDYYRRYQERAGFYYVAGRWKEGLDDIERAIQMAPEVAANYLFRGDFYMVMKRREEAIADFRRILALEQEGTIREAAVMRLRLLGLTP